MNAERLLQLYDRVSDAPDAIPKLRRFILDLAIRGKLVEQDPKDGMASDLLGHIEVEKEELFRQGIIQRRKITTRGRKAPLEFKRPPGWELSDLGRISIKITDGAHKTPTYVEKGVPFISIKDFSGGNLDLSNTRCIPESEHEVLYRRCDPRRGDILIGRIGTLGKAVLVDTDVEFSLFVSVGLIRFNPSYLHPEFLRLTLNSPFVAAEFDRIKIGGGTHTNKLNLGDLHGVAIPIPPFPEQQRIVEKVDELMALCDSLEAKREKREVTRDRLTTASLSRLTAQGVDEKQFKANAGFAINVLPELTTRPDQIKMLRQTILDLAVRGKLVEQDPNDELAAELLQKIKIEKARLVQAGRFKTLEAEFSRKPDDFPFSLPKVWTWTYLDDLAAVARGGSPRPIKSYLTTEQNGIPWIKIGDSVRGSIYIDSTKEKIRPEGLSKSRLVVPGDLLLSNSMSFGYPYITNVEGCIHDGWLVIRTPETLINKLFLHAVFCSSHAKESFLRAASGAVVQNLNADKARSLSIPLPPLAEQHRIVAKVDELMAHCDQLELALHSGRGTRRHLLEALLVGALEPLAMEAA